MSKLSKDLRARLDVVVWLVVDHLERYPDTLRRLHWSRPDGYLKFVADAISANQEFRSQLPAESVDTIISDKKFLVIKASIRRLIYCGRIRKVKIDVPVIIGGSGDRRIVNRKASYYATATILDNLSSC